MNAITNIGTFNDADLFRQQALIGGIWREADTKAVAEVTNPASLNVLGTVPNMGGDETRAAIGAAAEAFGSWKKKTHAERGGLLERWHDLIRQYEQDLALLLTLEQGKPLAEALAEIRYGASFVKWFAEEARRIGGSTIPSPTADRRILVLKEAVGVCAIITPWNFPNAMITRKVAPALAAGCTVVIKPSEFTPFSALALGVLADRAGIPAGVINIVTGMPIEIGNELMANETVRKISFTGSTRVGALLMRGAADSIKRLSLELGGNAPFIDLDNAVEGLIVSKFRNGGQTCVCANRILVQEGVYDAFAEKLSQRVTRMKVGAGTDEGTEIGPMINAAAIDKIERHIADAKKKGAQILAQSEAVPDGRQYARPVVLGGATTEMLLASEETFGPVAPLFRFETEEEAITIANGTPFGLAAYFYTDNLKRSWRVAEALEFGMVGLNTGMISTEVAPFGGVKQSGVGREGSQLGIEEYLEVKTLHVGGLNTSAG
jgi:succinate-semialdehyde dehydrogenase/glutarate-semialdehyde dehydrogenase